MTRAADALERIAFARRYTVELLDTIDPADWFRTPAGGVTHVAWQVGHLATSQYATCLKRVRGERPDDVRFLPAAFVPLFGRTSVADPDPGKYPPAAAIRATLDRVHERVLAELPAFPDADLDAPLDVPHRLCRTKIEFIRWCSAHEMIHAGQIALMRRLFGQKPIW